MFAVLVFKNLAAGKGSLDDRYAAVAELLERLGTAQVRDFAATFGRLRSHGEKGRGRDRIQVNCIIGPCHPPQGGRGSVFIGLV